MTPTTLLDAINSILSTLGSAPVESLANTASVEVTLAKNVLSDVMRDIQVKGWRFNTVSNYPLLQREGGDIVLPQSCIKVDFVENKPFLVQRGFHLYDVQNHTYTIKGPLKAQLVMGLDFEELPEAFRRYVLIRAARIFSDRILGSGALHSFTESDELAALSSLRNAENDLTNPNILHGNGYFHSLLER
jgi:hypothetical protein